MKRNKTLKELLIAIISIVPLLYYFYLWSSLPESIPVHFDAHGNPDNYENKDYVAYGLFFVTVGIYLFLKFIPRVYRKSSFTIASESFDKLRLILALFFSTLFIITIFSFQEGKTNITLICITIAVLISILGNYMGNLRPNHFTGNRFPWTNTDEHSWKKTQKFIGKLWFFSGIVLVLLLLVIPADYLLYVLFISLILLMIVLPSAYSFHLKSKKKRIAKNASDESTEKSAGDKSTNTDHWLGLFYFNRNDKRVLVPKRVPDMGWTLNFANPYSIILLIIIILFIAFNIFLK